MPIEGYQDFWVVGTQIHLLRDDIDGVKQPIVDLGVITGVTPAFTATTISLKDSRSGTRVTVAEEVTDFEEAYDVSCANFNLKNLALVFAAEGAEEFTQSATPLLDINHTAHKGELIALHDAAGVRMFQIASIQAIHKGATPLVLDTDYEIVDLALGLIRIKSGTAIVSDGDTLLVDFTPSAITGKRLVKPQTDKAIKGTSWLVWSRGNNTEQTVRECRVSVTSNSPELNDADFSSLKLRFGVINDPQDVASPAGRLLYTKGALPSQS